MRHIHPRFGYPIEIDSDLKRQFEAWSKPVPKPSAAYGSLGEPITRDNLPAVNVARWEVKHKLAVVALVNANIMSIDELWQIYGVTAEEYTGWTKNINGCNLKSVETANSQPIFFYPGQNSISPPNGIQEYNGIKLYPSSGKLVAETYESVHLTRREAGVLSLLLSQPGRVITDSMIHKSIYDETLRPNLKSIKAHICTLRKKVKYFEEAFTIETVLGRGYRLT